MPRDHHFLIAGIRYLWRYTKLRGTAAGWTYFRDDSCKTAPKILIDQRLKGRARLETELHEGLHGSFPQLSEETITVVARDLSKVLWFLGYRIDETKVPPSD